MKTILFTFSYDDFKAREVLLSARGKLAHLGYEALSPLDLKPGDDLAHATTDFIKRASLVIAFVTERSANVLFETGYAYGIGKSVILVSDMSANLPTDLRSVVSIDSRSAPSEITFEIVKQLSRLESSGWQPETELPGNLRDMLEARRKRPELFELVSEVAFTQAIADEFITQGWEVQREQGSQEYGFDLRIRDRNTRSMLVEIKKRTAVGERVLVTTLTKKLSEQLTDYLANNGIKVRYLHSDIDTVERVEIIRDLRLGVFDVLVGINLLREGLDIPEVSLVAILDADKEGFLRSTRSLIQTMGRAARHLNGTAILYADRITDSMQRAMDETERRRNKQIAHNLQNNITPVSVHKRIKDIIDGIYDAEVAGKNLKAAEEAARYEVMSEKDLSREIRRLEKAMQEHARNLEFEQAAAARDELFRIKQLAFGGAAHDTNI